jgi:hypothetical protein
MKESSKIVSSWSRRTQATLKFSEEPTCKLDMRDEADVKTTNVGVMAALAVSGFGWFVFRVVVYHLFLSAW